MQLKEPWDMIRKAPHEQSLKFLTNDPVGMSNLFLIKNSFH